MCTEGWEKYTWLFDLYVFLRVYSICVPSFPFSKDYH